MSDTFSSGEFSEEAPPAPASPAKLRAWALAWAGVAVLGFVVLALNLSDALSFGFSGQRTFGIVVFTPVIGVILAIVCFVRSVGAARSHSEYHARWSETQRAQAEQERLARQPVALFLAFAWTVAAVWLAGTIAVIVFLPSLSRNLDGLSLAAMLLALLAMAWVPVMREGFRARNVQRVRP